MNKIKFPLRLQFSILIGVLVIVLVSIIGISLTGYLKKKLGEEVLKRGAQLIRGYKTVALESHTIKDEFSVISYSKNLLNEEGVQEAFFVTKDGYVAAHSDESKITLVPDENLKDKAQFPPSAYYNQPYFLKGEQLKGKAWGFQYYQNKKFYDIYAPVKGKKKYFGDVHIIFSRSIIFKSIKQAGEIIIIIALITIGLGLIGAMGLSSSITRPIKKLAKGVQVIGTGNLEYKIEIHSKDEIGLLASEFNDMTGKLKEAQKSMIEKQKLESEIEIASEIQTMLLPKTLPKYSGLDLTAFYQPAKKVGGDYYDFIKISDDKLGIVVADVSGKSISGSLGMAMFRSIFHSTVRPDLDAYDTLCHANRLIQPDFPVGMFITAFYGILDIKTKILDYANAGHDPLIIYNSGTSAMYNFNADGPPVGIMEPAMFNNLLQKRKLAIKKNDIIIQYSDGVPEGMNIDKNQYGEERFYNAIKQYSHLPVPELIDAIKNDLFEFTKGAVQSDDITLIAVKLTE